MREKLRETVRCLRNFGYFADTCCQVLDTQDGEWKPFKLWPMQHEVARLFQVSRLAIALKARQLGLTWLATARVLHTLLFRPNVHGLIFSLRDVDAKQNLQRLEGMARRLPEWMRPRVSGNTHELRFDNGSKAFAFPTTAGDGYTAAVAMVDEADLVPDLDVLLRRVKPTIDNGGQLLLVSRANKDEPQSYFKQIYRAAKDNRSSWKSIFLPWHAHPGRTAEWYEEQRRDCESTTGSLDSLYEQYPSTDDEALAPRVLSKRIPFQWIADCWEDAPENVDHGINIPGLRVWELPRDDRYVIGVDVAEGKAKGDESAAVCLDSKGRQVAELSGRIELGVFAEYLLALQRAYNARLLVERNNHGHAIILRLADEIRAKLIRGVDGNRGFLSNAKGKAELYTVAAETFRDKETVIRSSAAKHQLMSIERSTLLAPKGMHDDLADAYALSLVALRKSIGNYGDIMEF